MNEQWSKLVYNGDDLLDRFEISSFGRLRNPKTGRIYKLFVSSEGYVRVCVSVGSRQNKKVIRIHRAVAETFLENKRKYPVVNHKDGNKSNNRVDNLEWCTFSENAIHAIETGLIDTHKRSGGENNGKSKLLKTQIEAIMVAYKPRDPVLGTRGLARLLGVDHMTVSRIVRGKTWAVESEAVKHNVNLKL